MVWMLLSLQGVWLQEVKEGMPHIVLQNMLQTVTLLTFQDERLPK
jgi:hypothetical protein